MYAVNSWQHIVESVRKQCQLDVNSVVAQLIKLLEFMQRLNNFSKKLAYGRQKISV